MAGNDDGAWQHENEHAEEDFLPDVSLAEGSKPTRYRNGRTYGSYFSRDGEALTRRQRLLLLGGCIFTCLYALAKGARGKSKERAMRFLQINRGDIFWLRCPKVHLDQARRIQ